ncbi:zinc-dependent alcohol dehydrogenase family protein [Congregibacter litoralis]|uniref:NADPH:quinone reductase n=1 Tax=Congregibacter litoralis KT71 TaxID=314285 RepID=A4A7Y9_9GAMM|nr:NAD(P)-dependent alcohol dehydrogenase [Congregibacter litoralis]EAQ97784.2 NADPH:quinone reductase [Congregibacter litoralis KT71]
MQHIYVTKSGGLDGLTLGETEPRAPDAGEVQVRVQASSLNYHDYLVAAGLLPVDDHRIPMSDGAGEVTAVGEGVTDYAVGDRVMSCFFPNWEDGGATLEGLLGVPGDHVDGFASETVTMAASAFSPMPGHMSFAEAATLPCAGLTAWRALVEETSLQEGEWVLVQGTGGVSIFAMQIARHLGCKVLATSSSEAKLQKLKELGADEVINYREEPEWGRRAAELTGGVSLVVEVGGPGTVTQSVRALRVGGAISMIGVLTGISGDVPLAEFFQRNATMSGITVGSRQHQANMTKAFEDWELRPVLDRSFQLKELTEAFRYQESGQHFGKIGLDLS